MTPEDVDDIRSLDRQVLLCGLIIEHAKLLFGPVSKASNERLEEIEQEVEKLGYTPEKCLEWEIKLVRTLGFGGDFIPGEQRWLN